MPSPSKKNPGQPTIAVLGTGRMGTPIARNLLAAGFPVSVWDRTPARLEGLASDGARPASSPAEAAEGADVVLTMLPDGATAEQVMSGGVLATMRPESVWIQMGTIGDDWTQRLSSLATQHGLEYVDSPVSGSDGPARDRQLIILASGPEKARGRVQPIFDALGRETLWLGPAGNGSRFKLVLNNWLATQVEAVAETIALTEALDIDPNLFIETIADGPLGSPYAVAKGRAMIDGDFAPGFALRLAFKDAELALDAARERHLELPVTRALAPRWQQAIADGHADEDVSAVIAAASPNGRSVPPA